MGRTLAQVDDRLTTEILTRSNQLKGVTGSVLLDRIVALEKAVADLTPTMPPPPPPAGNVREFSGTAAELVTLLGDQTLDTILMRGKTYPSWQMVARSLQRSKPVRVMAYPGETVILDGGGTISSALRVGTNDGGSGYPTVATNDISFEDLILQRYNVGKDGVMKTGWATRIAFKRIAVRDVAGMGPGSYSHVGYVESDLTHRGMDILFEDIDVQGNQTINGIQTYHNPNAAGVTVRRGVFRGLYRAFFIYGNPTGVLIDGTRIEDCTATIDSVYQPLTGDQPQGVVQNTTALRSGPMAPGQGSWQMNTLTAGVGNSVTL